MIRTKKANEGFRTTIGGSALIEGIMMRGPDKSAAVVRGKDGIAVKEKKITPLKDKYPVLGWLFIRGIVGFAGSMKDAMEALTFSAEAAGIEDSESKFDKWLEEKFGGGAVTKMVTAFAAIIGVVLAVGLFIVLPAFLAGLFATHIAELGGWRAAFEGGVRLVLFLLYIILVSQMSDIKRVFSYHGAEHKTIACYEAGEELTVENVKKYSRFHPRCGTSFLFMVVIIGIVAFLWVTNTNILIRVGLKLLMLPFVAAISYEVNRFLGRHDDLFCRVVRAPGIWIQRLTTNEPDDSMIEIGIEAMNRVIPNEKGTDEW
ncbi:MAG: DUF1385 domain-containing protein [Oscillospiraceae bacterium]|nr:DUF1385 domain-containing protein [Oscillospiraceae bacterium]